MSDAAPIAEAFDIAWVAPGIPSGDLDASIRSYFASHRYRVLLPGAELQARGHRIQIVDPRPGVEAPISRELHAVIIGKFTNPDLRRLGEHVAAALDYAERACRLGIRIIVDICDNHFDDPVRGEFARNMLQLADSVVVGSSAMGEVVRRYSDLPQTTIGDPVEGRWGAPALASGIWQPPSWWRRFDRASGATQTSRRPLRLLWFGHQSGLHTLEAAIPEIERLCTHGAIDLELVCAPGFGAEALCGRPGRASGLSMRFSTWSVEQTWNSLQHADLVVIPGDVNDERRSVKTENRLVESLWAGRFVVANPIPAYRRFEDCAWISEDLATGVKWAVGHPELAIAQVARAQAMIEAHYLPRAIGAQWEAWIAQTVQRGRSGAQAAGAAPPLRLNLGCGDKILPGYLNVDVASSRNGVRPDVICDLRDLSAFASGSADEILSVHVIEHFWRWEVDAIIAEWLRVLKPGGRMVVECPNLAAACAALLADPDAGPGVEGNRSLWVLYGDPAWRDPLMCHRWGYTPATLARLLQSAGLTQVRQEAAEFKMREPRDMRVVGVKRR